jgi:hypothetical protein
MYIINGIGRIINGIATTSFTMMYFANSLVSVRASSADPTLGTPMPWKLTSFYSENSSFEFGDISVKEIGTQQGQLLVINPLTKTWYYKQY